MYEIKRRARALTLGISFCLLSWLPTAAQATAEIAQQQQVVRELIALENQQLQAPQRTATAAITTHPINKMPNFEGPDLILHAVYGVGQRLIAEVTFRGRNYLYLRGQAWPLGDTQGRSQLRLIEISSRCVRLAQKEQSFDACV